jgi:hypothetical protein
MNDERKNRNNMRMKINEDRKGRRYSRKGNNIIVYMSCPYPRDNLKT